MTVAGSEADASERSRISRSGANAGLVLVGVVTFALCAQWLRPMRWDEFVQFALAGMGPGAAWDSLIATTGNGLNHGQTGLYFILDYGLLSVFGANLLALRLPSIIAGVFLVAAGVAILRTKGLAFQWQVVFVIAVCGHGALAYSMSDARPYIVIAATSMCLLAYYLYPIDSRRGWAPRLLGAFGLFVGAVNHPYFAVGLVTGFGFGWWLAGFERGRRLRWAETVALLNPLMAVPAMAIFVAVGWGTWLKGSPEFSRDPFQLIGTGWEAAHQFVGHHLGMLGPLHNLPIAVTIGTGLVLLVAMLAALVPQRGRASVLPSVILFWLSLSTSALLSLMSYARDYPIFPYQWTAPMAVCVLAFTWFLASVQDVYRGAAARWLVRVAVLLILVNVALSAALRISEAPGAVAYWQGLPVYAGDPDLPTDGFSIDQWVEYGNVNLASGGAVWPSIGRYYDLWVPSVDEESSLPNRD